MGHFDINKTCKLMAQKYYWLTLPYNVEAYVKSCDVCLALKMVQLKLYNDLQFWPVSTNQWKNLLMDFVIRLPISTN